MRFPFLLRSFNLITFNLFFFIPILIYGQTETNVKEVSMISRPVSLVDSIPKKDCEIKDVGDVARDLFKKKKKEKTPQSQKKVNMLIQPALGYNPANGFQLGVSAISSLSVRSKENTRISYARVKLMASTKRQFISFIKSNIYTDENKFFFLGDWRYSKFNETTYGLGTNSPEEINLNPNSRSQSRDSKNENGYPIQYDFIMLHEIVNRKVITNFYLGLGYHLDAYRHIDDQNLNLDSIPVGLTPHWSYSKLHGFDPENYTMSGFSVNAMYDSRDNQINAYKGYYAMLNYRVNQTFMGSNQNSTQLWTEFRTYIGLSKKTPRHLIAFWYFGNFLVSGEQPYLTLMALGDDQRLKSGRGYTAGRFRGQDYMYAEAEYRFPILKCAQTLGGVVFVNASTASNRDRNVHLFDYVRPAVGFGFRILMKKHARMNISIDFAYGFDSNGVYFGGTETF